MAGKVPRELLAVMRAVARLDEALRAANDADIVISVDQRKGPGAKLNQYLHAGFDVDVSAAKWHVENIAIPEPKGGWRAARGAAPAKPGDPPPEETIRAMRGG